MTDLTKCSTISSEEPVPRYCMGVDIGMRNLALSVVDSKTMTTVYLDVWDILLQRSQLDESALSARQEKKLNKKCTKKASVYDLVEGVCSTLRTLHAQVPEMEHVCHVMIENQPHYKLPHMKNIAVAIHTFYTLTLPGCRVQYMQSMSKFNGMRIEKSRLKKYNDRKRVAVECCIDQMEGHNDVIGMSHLALFKKKDDLADAYLLALQGVSTLV